MWRVINSESNVREETRARVAASIKTLRPIRPSEAKRKGNSDAAPAVAIGELKQWPKKAAAVAVASSPSTT
jgi:DNA-binding LacI/PurR family transcriptional regulator